MTYVDGFAFPVARKNLKAYEKMAKEGGKIWKKHGALQYLECIGDDLDPNKGKTANFRKVMKAKPGDVVFFSFIVYKSKAHRDAVNAKVMKDPAMSDPSLTNGKMPFDMKRMAYGGFRAIVEA